VIGEKYLYTKRKFKAHAEKYNKLIQLFDNRIPLNTYIYDRDKLGHIRFDESLDRIEDWDFLIKLGLDKSFTSSYVDKDVSEYHKIDDGSDSHNNTEEDEKLWEGYRKKVLNNYRKEEVRVPYEDVIEFRKEYIKLIKEKAVALELINNIETSLTYRLINKIRSTMIFRLYKKSKGFLRKLISF
jgi:hypothetical protein